MMMTPWVQRLLIANVIMFFVSTTSAGLFRDLMFVPQFVLFRPWTIVTYMFLHGSFGHLFFNMLGILIFGPRLEERMGARRFLTMYFLAGIAGAALQTVGAPASAMVGASAGVYAVVVGFATYWPNEVIMLIFPPIPMKAWILGTGYVLLSVYNGIAGTQDGVAHFAHLGGAAAGFAYIKWSEWRRGASKRDFQRKMKTGSSPTGVVGDRIAVAKWKGISVEGLHELNREEVERLLAKVSSGGASALSASEREFLDRMAAGG
ncbi:MAG: rhomboid family intramembrane serine protease [Gemmatimonadota bacterium]